MYRFKTIYLMLNNNNNIRFCILYKLKNLNETKKEITLHMHNVIILTSRFIYTQVINESLMEYLCSVYVNKPIIVISHNQFHPSLIEFRFVQNNITVKRLLLSINLHVEITLDKYQLYVYHIHDVYCIHIIFHEVV